MYKLYIYHQEEREKRPTDGWDTLFRNIPVIDKQRAADEEERHDPRFRSRGHRLFAWPERVGALQGRVPLRGALHGRRLQVRWTLVRR
jgi:hypothetical protein